MKTNPSAAENNQAVSAGAAGGGNSLLLRFIESSHFSMFMCVSYLERYASNPGIHWYLCNKLRSYPSDEIEFFLPQLVQLQVTVETDSMALEDLLLDLCNDSTHCTLLVFWQLQAHLTLLSDDPNSYGFQACKRIYNKLQYLLFNVGEPPSEKMRENVFPSTVLASMISASIACPPLLDFIKPLVVSQGRKQRSHIFHVASKLLRTNSTPDLRSKDKNSSSSSGGSKDSKSISASNLGQVNKSADQLHSYSHEDEGTDKDFSGGFSADSKTTATAENGPEKSNSITTATIKPLTNEEKVRALKTNYFRCETQFMYALESISTRLMTVPKQARLSALRAELVLINRELPAEIDIPLLLPSDKNGSEVQQHKIVRISPAEATVLNSAEKVPFLLLIEYLKNEVDFNPENPANEHLWNADRRYIFDMAHLHGLALKHNNHQHHHNNPEEDEEEEVAESDIGSISALNTYDEDLGGASSTNNVTTPSLKALVQDGRQLITPVDSPRLGSSTNTGGTNTPRQSINSLHGATSALNLNVNVPGAANSPRPSDLSFSSSYFTVGPDDDVNEIASHMRTAAVMLNQLDSAASGLNHKDEVNEIKSKIIASMQSMEDHTLFHINQVAQNNRLAETEPAGDRRTENDLKIASTKSDDPSAANLGEDWNSRKERIRRTSPYGHLPNWDVFSIIAKTGNDLRQEAFACQLIQAMTKIWAETGVDVWVKKMSILITSESYGLVETITNGLSIHSIKKALTNETVRNGTNPKGTIAGLKDYFKAKFPTEDSYNEALQCFVKSLAPYSLICYLLQIKDRHNGNILLDSHGHIIHIDFGFLLTNTPGSFGFETAPFKLTQEYVDLMGGSTDSPEFTQFRQLLKQCFRTIRKHADAIIILVEMMSKDSDLPCFESENASLLLRQRFQLHLSDAEADQFVDNVLIQKSLGSMYTRLYDQYQLLTQGIYS